MTSTTTQYTALLERAQRNFALCVIQIEGPKTISFDARHEWRKKADRLQWAINEARECIKLGCIGAACTVLRRENEPK